MAGSTIRESLVPSHGPGLHPVEKYMYNLQFACFIWVTVQNLQTINSSHMTNKNSKPSRLRSWKQEASLLKKWLKWWFNHQNCCWLIFYKRLTKVFLLPKPEHTQDSGCERVKKTIDSTKRWIYYQNRSWQAWMVQTCVTVFGATLVRHTKSVLSLVKLTCNDKEQEILAKSTLPDRRFWFEALCS